MVYAKDLGAAWDDGSGELASGIRESGFVRFGDGSCLETNNVVCTIGNAPNSVLSALKAEYEKGKLLTDEFLRVKGYEETLFPSSIIGIYEKRPQLYRLERSSEREFVTCGVVRTFGVDSVFERDEKTHCLLTGVRLDQRRGEHLNRKSTGESSGWGF